MEYQMQTYIYGMVLELQKQINSGYLSYSQNLLENRTLILKVPRAIGKTYLINALALDEINPAIYVKSQQRLTGYNKILHRYIRNMNSLRFPSSGGITALFFDEISNTDLINKVVREVTINNHNIKYVLALST